MDLDLDETQSLLQQTVREYLARELPFDRVRELEREQRHDAQLWKAVAEQGWLGLPFSERDGGGGGSLVDLGLVVEEFARRAALVPIVEATVAGLVIARHGPPELARQWLPPLLAGELVPVPALLERGDCFDEVGLVCSSDGRLHGEKYVVDYGQLASHHLVSARDAAGIGLYWVDARLASVACRPLRSIGRTPVCDVGYDDAPALRVAGAEAVAELVRLGRVLAALQCVGSMQQALDMTVAYAKVREQFGKPIGSFQAVRHHCADMAIRVASARDLAFEALSALDAGRPADALVAAAKASASRAAPEVTMLAHQIHGGNGVIEENDLYFFTLRGKDRSLAWGTVDECLGVLSAGLEHDVEWL